MVKSKDKVFENNGLARPISEGRPFSDWGTRVNTPQQWNLPFPPPVYGKSLTYNTTMATTLVYTILRTRFSRAVDATKNKMFKSCSWVNDIANSPTLLETGVANSVIIGSGLVLCIAVSACVRYSSNANDRVIDLLDGHDDWDCLPGEVIEAEQPLVVEDNSRASNLSAVDSESVTTASSGNPIFCGMELETTPFKVSAHKRVRNRVKYAHLVIAECKIKFGIPRDTAANRAAVRRHASKLMQQHGVRPSHVRREIPQIVEMTFVPDTWELKAARMRLSSEALGRIWEFNCYKAAAEALGAEAHLA